MGKKLSFAQFKRDAKAGMGLELTERFGKTEFPERLQGVRKVYKVNSAGVRLVTDKGEKSVLYLERASLAEYDGDTLAVYDAGRREPDEKEKAVLEGWEHKLAEYEKEHPYGDPYWAKKDYFANSPCPWMAGFEKVRGKRYQSWDGKVLDESIKGELILKYNVIHA